MSFIKNSCSHSRHPDIVIMNSYHSSQPKQPAYDGAKFDVDGRCLKHPHILMCKLKKSPKTKEEIQKRPGCNYVIVRKTCNLCGEHALRNERKINKKSWSHGYNRTKWSPKGPVGVNTHTKMSNGHTSSGHSCVRVRGYGGRNAKISPSAPSYRLPESTSPISLESAGSGRTTKSPLPLPNSETRLGKRRRLRGAIPSNHRSLKRPNTGTHCSNSRGISIIKSRKSGTRDNSTTIDEYSNDASGGAETERHANGERARSKRSHQPPVSLLKTFDQLCI